MNDDRDYLGNENNENNENHENNEPKNENNSIDLNSSFNYEYDPNKKENSTVESENQSNEQYHMETGKNTNFILKNNDFLNEDSQSNSTSQQPNNTQWNYSNYQQPQNNSMPNWSTPNNTSQQPQQTQWTYGMYNNQKPPKPPKKQKMKKEKKPKSPNHGIKVFAIIMSVLFVLSTGSLAAYIAYTAFEDNDNKYLSENNQQTEGKTDTDKPSVDIKDTPSNQEVTAGNELTNAQINKKVGPSVVGVASYIKTTGYQLLGQGSGVIMTADGYIVTNAHVVNDTEGRRQIVKIEVILNDGKTYTADVIGSDLETDLAVLKIKADNLPAAEFGDSNALQIGDRVVVIGNPDGLKYAGSQTHGFVSALNRSVYMNQLGTTMEYIQTDAAINPGNSGGAFINAYGQVVGISSAKLVAEGFEGMGFAIPINNAKPVIDSLIKNGYVAGRVKIGIMYTPISEAEAGLYGIPRGLRVVEVEENSDVSKKGLQKGDIITKMDGKDVYDTETIGAVLDGKSPGDAVTLTIFHVEDNGRAKTFDITAILSERKS